MSEHTGVRVAGAVRANLAPLLDRRSLFRTPSSFFPRPSPVLLPVHSYIPMLVIDCRARIAYSQGVSRMGAELVGRKAQNNPDLKALLLVRSEAKRCPQFLKKMFRT